MNKRIISITIPVYNEASNIRIAVESIERVFREKLEKYDLELIITDNASTDNTWEIIQELASTRSNLRAFCFSRNFGYQNSVFAGMFLATGDAVIEIDADLEDPPEFIPEFVKKWEEGYQVVYGIRKSRSTSIGRKIPIYLFYRILNTIVDHPIPNDAGDFRLLDSNVVNILKELPERNLYLRGLVAFVGFKQIGLPYHRNPRLSGSSKFRFLHYIILAIDAITAFSKTPLRFIGILGIIIFIITLSMGIYYLVSTILYGREMPGFSTLVVLTLFLHSLTFIFIGIIGEYMSRIFDDSKNRPRVIISKSLNAIDNKIKYF